MKTKLIKNRAGVAVAALVASIGLTTSAKATLFQNLPATAPGDQYVFKLANFDNGTLYNGLPLNGTLGVSDNPAAGSAILDAGANIAAQAVGAHAIAPFLGGVATGTGLEDSWGIATITQIFKASDPVTPVWQAGAGPGTDNQQLTVMFYGEQDFFLKQVAANAQLTDGVGLHADFYLQDVANGSFTSFNNGGARPADIAGFTQANDASFPTVTDSNGTLFTAGVPVLKLLSTPGFINGPGILGGVATEFETTFNGNALNGFGQGSSYLNVVGGSLAGVYNTNSFVSPYLANTFADVSVQFTTTTAGAAPNWLVSSQDPMRTVAVPEPTTVLAGLGCMAPILSSLLARRRKSA